MRVQRMRAALNAAKAFGSEPNQQAKRAKRGKSQTEKTQFAWDDSVKWLNFRGRQEAWYQLLECV